MMIDYWSPLSVGADKRSIGRHKMMEDPSSSSSERENIGVFFSQSISFYTSNLRSHHVRLRETQHESSVIREQIRYGPPFLPASMIRKKSNNKFRHHSPLISTPHVQLHSRNNTPTHPTSSLVPFVTSPSTTL